jgi:rRNA biogenesis protein RRP5
MLVSSLITSEQPSGLNLQILGFFDGTVDQFHLSLGAPDKAFKIGKKVKARVLYDIPGSPPRFALSVSHHVLALSTRSLKEPGKRDNVTSVQDAYPIGKILDTVKVARVETDRGLVVEISPGLQGFIHVVVTLATL